MGANFTETPSPSKVLVHASKGAWNLNFRNNFLVCLSSAVSQEKGVFETSCKAEICAYLAIQVPNSIFALTKLLKYLLKNRVFEKIVTIND